MNLAIINRFVQVFEKTTSQKVSITGLPAITCLFYIFYILIILPFIIQEGIKDLLTKTRLKNIAPVEKCSFPEAVKKLSLS